MKVSKILKAAFALIFTVFIIALVLRILMLEDKRELSDVYPTDEACSAFAQSGEAAFLTHRTADEISPDGYFGAYAMCYIKPQSQLQITARFNDSLYERYLYGSDPELYKWEIRDENGNTLSEGKVLQTSEKYRYNYVRLSFDGVDIEDGDVYYLFLICDECDYPDKSTEGFRIHIPENEFKGCKLSSGEIAALEKNG